MPYQLLNLSFWMWCVTTPAGLTRDWFRAWNAQGKERVADDTHVDG